MQSLIYASLATRELHSGELIELLDVARTHNERAGVTGMLLYTDRSFLQQLEGPDDAVAAIFAAIERDDRHTAVRVLRRAEVAQRDFAAWSMGFVDTEPHYLAQFLPGYLPTEHFPFSREDLLSDGTTARRLLLSLRPESSASV